MRYYVIGTCVAVLAIGFLWGARQRNLTDSATDSFGVAAPQETELPDEIPPENPLNPELSRNLPQPMLPLDPLAGMPVPPLPMLPNTMNAIDPQHAPLPPHLLHPVPGPGNPRMMAPGFVEPGGLPPLPPPTLTHGALPLSPQPSSPQPSSPQPPSPAISPDPQAALAP